LKRTAGQKNCSSSKKGNQWYFGMKAHIGVGAESGLVQGRA
jgi:IS5 family transposase